MPSSSTLSTRPATTTRTKQQIFRKLNHLNPEEVGVTPDEILLALKRTKASKTLGPDDLAAIHLQHLGASGLHYLTTVINLSINSTKIPTRWKEGRIIPLLKPGKPADQGKSYHPITLMSPVAKLVEKLLLLRLQEHLPLADHQHGRSTTTALNCVTHKISTGLNRPKPYERTVLVDLTSAFDTESQGLAGRHLQHQCPPTTSRNGSPPTSMEDPPTSSSGGRHSRKGRCGKEYLRGACCLRPSSTPT